MRRLSVFHKEANRIDLEATERREARYKLAEYLSANPDGLYFNDSIWHGYQSYVFQGATESRLTRAEREGLLRDERKLKDDQEERWRAYLILRELVRESGNSDLGRKSARLAINCLRKISTRFGREDEIHKADTELSNWLRNPNSPL